MSYSSHYSTASASDMSSSTNTSHSASSPPVVPFKLLFVTGNAGKAREVGEILGGAFTIENKRYDIPEIQGDSPSGSTNYEKALNHSTQIAMAKARKCADDLGVAVLTEDTSLFLTELMNPGPFVKFWSNDAIYKASVGCVDKSIYAVSIFTFCKPGGTPVTFTGVCQGYVCSPETGKGTNGFGWDPVFVPVEGDGRSFAQMTNDEKNKVSHRRRALDVLKRDILSCC
jgi:non-canonical purine NTP pyrophosphatase (RdgB/HAM1 family)